jgi:hypothetical protein
LKKEDFGVPWDVQLYRDYGFFDFRLETVYYRGQNTTSQFYNCKLVVHPKLKGGCIWRLEFYPTIPNQYF